jgi:single-strand DNA-binding protein
MLRCSIIGNLGADPEVRYSQKGEQITTIRVAVNQHKKDPDSDEWRDSTNWFRVRCAGWTAEAASKLSKGMRVYVVGRLEINEYQRRDGGQGVSYDIWPNEIHSMDRGQRQEAAASAPAGRGAAQQDGDLEDIPF